MAALRVLDPRLVKVVGLWRSSKYGGERRNAERCGEALAAEDGLNFQQAVDAVAASERRAATIALYGSERAALAPCERELRLRKAVRQWTVPCNQRWTRSVDGCVSSKDRMPKRVAAALATAYALPVTMEGAAEENRHWIRRSQEIDDVLRYSRGLDLIAEMRAAMVRDVMIRTMNMRIIQSLNDRLDRRHALNSVCRFLRQARTVGGTLSVWERTHIGIAIGHILLERYDLVAGEVDLASGTDRGGGGIGLPDGFEAFQLSGFERVVAELMKRDAAVTDANTLPLDRPEPEQAHRIAA